jgi:hypothetical protein
VWAGVKLTWLYIERINLKKFILFFTCFIVSFISQAMQASQYITTRAQNGQELFEFVVISKNFADIMGSPEYSDIPFSAMQYASDYWSSLLGNLPMNSKAAVINIGISNDDTKSSCSVSNYDINGGGLTHLANAILRKSNETYNIATGCPTLIILTMTPSTGQIKLLPDPGHPLAVTLMHEMGHSMGFNYELGRKDKDKNEFYFIGDSYCAMPNFSKRLVDSFGNPSDLDMEIIQSAASVPGKFAIIPKGDEVLDDSAGVGGYAFFQGPNVNEVINPQNLDDVYFPFNNPYHVHGVPINGFEKKDKEKPDMPELSHIELRNSIMSHQPYRNWTTFMEAELAILQDIGIPIDRRNFYGYSIYTSNGTHDIGNDHSFYARIYDKSLGGYRYDIGKFNKTPLTIGFHVYGSNNTISMSQEILTKGRASCGVRIEGVKNKLTITEKSNICANGEDGIGVLVSYGKDHTIMHKGTITATGKDGIGIRCDFGHNYLTDANEYRGSFINTKGVNNIPAHTALLPDELNGPLVTDLSISGNIKAEQAAIYISENAFVKNIQICDGAHIEGDIISRWSNNSAAINPRSNKGFNELNTKLIFGNNTKSEIICSGNISGNNAMSVSIPKGALYYSGKMSELRQFYVEPNAMLSVNTLSPSDIASIQAQEVKFKTGSSITNKYGKYPFLYRPQKTVLELISENIDIDKDIAPYVFSENNEFTLGFYDCPFSGHFIWVKSPNGLNLNLVLDPPAAPLRISPELTAAKASGAPLVMAACDNISANAIFNRADQLTSKREKFDIWQGPDIAFYAKGKGDLKCNVNSKAMVFGIDRKIEEEQNWLLGVGGEIAYPKYKSNDTNIETERFSGFIYGATNFLEEVNLSAFIKYGKNYYSQNRNIREEKYHNKYKGNQYDAGLKIDYPLKIGKAVKFEPFASYECIILDIDGYKEQKVDKKGNGKAAYALDFDKGASTTHRTNVGAKLDFNITKVINLDASLFYSGLYGSTNSNTLVKYSQAKDVCARSRGGELDKHSIGACINFKAQSTNRSNIILGYEVIIGKNYINNHFRASFSLKF